MIAPHIASLGVAEAAARVMDRARDVTIDAEAIRRFCLAYPDGDLPIPDWNRDLHWSDGTWRSANYVLILDALNFCFWSDPGQPRWAVEYQGRAWQGYWGLAAALRKAIEGGVPILEASVLARVTLDDVANLLAGQGQIPLLEARHAHLVQIGNRLLETYGGRFSATIEAARHDALDLVALTVRDFPCYRDEAEYEGLRVPLYKRAQILAVDLFGTFGGEAWGRLSRLDEITAFADYKVPQVLRRLGILQYSPRLSACLDALEAIPAGDPREVEIRAATVAAVESIRRTLAERVGRSPRSFEIDWHLWGIGQEPSPEDRPYHRTRTTAY